MFMNKKRSQPLTKRTNCTSNLDGINGSGTDIMLRLSRYMKA